MREITIALPDKREIKGKVIGTDPATDIALLKIPTSPACRSCRGAIRAQLKVGEWVLAIGSPFQLSQTVTAGIVSATGRANMGFADYEDFIQTDAAINPGNSGGALINSRGELVGINTGIFSESGGYQGIGFAVPSNLAQRIVDDLMKYGEVRRGIDRLHRHREADAAAGGGVRRDEHERRARLAHEPRSEAYDAGLRPGDVIVGVQRPGRSTTRRSSCAWSPTRRSAPTATVKVLRAGRTLEFKLPIVSSATPRSRR